MLPNRMYPAQSRSNDYLPLGLYSIGHHKQPPVYQPNGANVCHVIIGKKGNGVFRIAGEHDFILSPQHAVIIKQRIPHEFTPVDEKWETVSIGFYCNPFVLAQFSLRAHRPISLFSLQRIMELTELLWRHGDQAQGSDWKTSEIIYSLLLEIKMQSDCLQQQASFPLMTIQKIMEYIHDHYANRLTLTELSRIFGYSPQHLNRIFRKELGYSVHQYILKIQLEQAAELLGNKMLTVEQVADRVGMEWRSFYRLFQRMYQRSPGQFRKDCIRKEPS
ncbi:AraC family transcriptional regulator [Paenibacillus sp. GCM10027628]|uniref:AraC family transcriptional regulator n=1 Tax=Paenibacillus sp. GCM10027628 TaxID=3273413 RepID=UPI003633F8C2